MTMKTKRKLTISGGTTLCAAFTLLIAMRFSPEDEQIAPSISETESAANVNIFALDKKQTENTELVDNTGSDNEVTY